MNNTSFQKTHSLWFLCMFWGKTLDNGGQAHLCCFKKLFGAACLSPERIIPPGHPHPPEAFDILSDAFEARSIFILLHCPRHSLLVLWTGSPRVLQPTISSPWREVRTRFSAVLHSCTEGWGYRNWPWSSKETRWKERPFCIDEFSLKRSDWGNWFLQISWRTVAACANSQSAWNELGDLLSEHERWKTCIQHDSETRHAASLQISLFFCQLKQENIYSIHMCLILYTVLW